MLNLLNESDQNDIINLNKTHLDLRDKHTELNNNLLTYFIDSVADRCRL